MAAEQDGKRPARPGQTKSHVGVRSTARPGSGKEQPLFSQRPCRVGWMARDRGHSLALSERVRRITPRQGLHDPKFASHLGERIIPIERLTGKSWGCLGEFSLVSSPDPAPPLHPPAWACLHTSTTRLLQCRRRVGLACQIHRSLISFLHVLPPPARYLSLISCRSLPLVGPTPHARGVRGFSHRI